MKSPNLEQTRRIVLIWLGRLGDLLVSTAVIASIRRRFPGAEITLVTGEHGASAAPLCQDIDDTLVLRRFHRPVQNLKLVRRLRGEPADLLIDLNSSFSKGAAALIRLVPAPVKVGFRKGRGDFAFTHLLEAPKIDEHMLDRYARLAKFIDAPYTPRLKVRVPEEARREAADALAAAGLGGIRGKKRIAVFPGNFKKHDNRWPEKKFAELAGRILTRSDAALFFLAGPGEVSKVKAIADSLDTPAPVLGPFPLETAAALLKRIDLLVANCTGTSHLATAVGTPSFTLLGGYTKTVWAPKDKAGGGTPHFDVVSDDWDSCRAIPVDTAWTALEKALNTLPNR